MAVSFETYYGENPIAKIDRNRWTMWDPFIDVKFRTSTLFTPLVRWEPLDERANKELIMGRELIPGHVNTNQIGLRQKYITAAYFDSRERKITANGRFGGKVQYDRYDPMVNMWQTRGAAGFAEGILRQHMARSIVVTHETLARNALLSNPRVKTYAGGATNFSGLAGSSDYKFDITMLREVGLRLQFRSHYMLSEFGDESQPVPGLNNELLCIVTPGIRFDVWDQIDSKYMKDLRDLGDQRIINGGVLRYGGWTFAESWDAVLWNAGALVKQVAVTAPINAGDGAPDPDSAPVDNIWMTGQTGVTHYVQCTDLGTGNFVAGDIVTLHVAKTSGNGVTDGVDVTDGRTMVLEVASVDEGNERLAFRLPVMDDYTESFQYTSLNGSGASGTAYAFVTKAAHVHPVYQVAARGGNLFAQRRGVQLHTPPAIDDFESVVRISWDEYGQMNSWNPDLWEVHFTRASFANTGAPTL